MQLHFAPLQGYTTALYRRLHHTMWGGIDYYYTPFVRIEKDSFRRRDLADISPENNKEIPTIPQMLPRDADELRRITQLFLSQGYTCADINMGCPFPPIALHKRGSGLLPHASMVEDLLAATKEFPEMKFSIKMRLGWQSTDEWKHLIDILNATPLTHVTIHPRIGQQQYKGDICYEAFEQLASRCSHPIIYNGDLCTPQDVEHILQQYNFLTGIMIGRGLLARPYLSLWLNNIRQYDPHSIICHTQLFHDKLFEALQQTSQGNSQLMQRAHAIWEYFLPHAPRKLRKNVIKSSSPTQYMHATDTLFDTWANDTETYPL